MSVPSGSKDAATTRTTAKPRRSVIDVAAHRSSPDRTVFTEADNADGWIATDLTVEPER